MRSYSSTTSSSMASLRRSASVTPRRAATILTAPLLGGGHLGDYTPVAGFSLWAVCVGRQLLRIMGRVVWWAHTEEGGPDREQDNETAPSVDVFGFRCAWLRGTVVSSDGNSLQDRRANDRHDEAVLL